MTALILFGSGAALALCLPRLGLCPLAWFVIAPLLMVILLTPERKRAACYGFIFGLGFFSVTLHWIYSTCRFALVPIPIAMLAWMALAAVLSLQWAAFAAGAHWARSRFSPGVWPWICAAIWAALEFAVSNFNPGLMKLAYTQWRFLSLIQGSAVFGPEGLGFLIILVNGAGAAAAASAARGSGRLTRLAPALALVLLWWGCGEWVLAGAKERVPQVSVGIVQPNVDQYRKWDSNYVNEIRENIGDLMQRLPADKSVKLVIWPESSVPGWLDAPENYNWVAGLAKKTGAYQLVGVLTQIQSQSHNSAVLISPEGNVEGYYHKRQLVPFGEFVPFRALFAPWIGILDQMGDFHAGDPVQPPIDTPIGKIGATVCFEAMFPPLVRSSVLNARLMANLTNDGWYRQTWGPFQHFYANIFRAVENRVTVIRAANTGISGVIDPYGNITARMYLGTRGLLVANVPAADNFTNRSLYNRWGDWFGWLNLAACGALALSALRRPA